MAIPAEPDIHQLHFHVLTSRQLLNISFVFSPQGEILIVFFQGSEISAGTVAKDVDVAKPRPLLLFICYVHGDHEHNKYK